MIFSILLLFASSLLHGTVRADDPDDIMMFVCDDYMGRTLKDLCISQCFGSFCAGNGQSLVHDSANDSTQHARARAAGCRPNPNRCAKTPYGSDYQCDEFPFKSVEDVSGGTRVNRCIPKKQNQDQSAIIKAFYGKKGYCAGDTPCSFDTGYENSGEIKYCNKKTCTNDGNEYTKGGKYPQARDVDSDASDAFTDVLFASPNVSSINYPTRFMTADGSEVVIPAGAQVGRGLVRIVPIDYAAWDQYLEDTMAAEANMTEDEYWEHQASPASARLMSLLRFEYTNVTAVLPDY